MELKHPSNEELRGYAGGKLTDSDWDSIDTHLSGCDQCRSRVEALSIERDDFLRGLKRGQADSASAIHPLQFTQTQHTPGARTSDSVPAQPDSDQQLPEYIGRYRVERLLGQGGFGRVYLAWDIELDRRVAVKVPAPKRLSIGAAESYRREARTIAQLDHPNIVAVYDSGSTDQFPVYIVSKYIEGHDLERTLNEGRLANSQAAELVATIADAAQHAHQQGLVHRDIKPANILLDEAAEPFLVDFGLALREQEMGQGSGYCGTPAYMSPEQARGEGHRVDGRSDIFSLGVVLYELLVGRRPFDADTQSKLFEQITSLDPRPPRQYNDTIPMELERICLKSLSKRAMDRYSTARDLADDLRHFLNASGKRVSIESLAAAGGVQTQLGVDKRSGASGPAIQPLTVVPKGLRSFDEQDSDFFLELLPGPRDRQGLPESIRFWKGRIEETDIDKTFSSGLIYGPSGCGKSSLVKAGLLPRLSEDIVQVYVEATPEETESRLLRGLRRHCPALDDGLDLRNALTAIRRGEGVAAGQKLLIVLDQFEQWLHTHSVDESTPLVDALRQCDGGRVQCVLLVRDDFWMAVTRFTRALEVRLVEGENSAAVDLFPVRHAENVLEAFGRAFGILPADTEAAGKEQKQFVKQAVAGLAEEGHVICVRLALFAEMMKGKPWTAATLKKLGGTQGVGVTFLEETFSASTAPPGHRYHQKAARAVLKALLPGPGANLKGEMKSYDELLDASCYASRCQDFDDLIKMLDSALRLITPTDPVGEEAYEHSAFHVKPGEKYFQLTHDYLVASLREWLTRKQKATRRGRAELLLAERAAMWNANPERRYLPSCGEWIKIRGFTDKKKWAESERAMMRRAATVRATQASLVFVVGLVALLSLVGLRGAWDQTQRRLHQGLASKALGEWERYDVNEAIATLEECPVDRRRWEWHYVRELCSPLLALPGVNAAIGPGGKQIAIENFGNEELGDYAGTGTVAIWDVARREELTRLEGSIQTMGFSPNGDWFATVRPDDSLTIWDARDGQEKVTVADGGRMTSAGFYSSDSKRFVFTTVATSFSNPGRATSQAKAGRRRFTTHRVEVWEIESGRSNESPRSFIGSHPTISSSGERFAHESEGLAIILDAASGRQLCTVSGKPVTFSPNGQQLATFLAGSESTVKIWDVGGGDPRVSLQVSSFPEALAFSSDGQRIATATRTPLPDRKSIQIFDAVTGEEVLEFEARGVANFPEQLLFRPSGGQIGLISKQMPDHNLKKVQIWDAESGDRFHEFSFAGVTSDIFAAASPNTREVGRPNGTRTALELLNVADDSIDRVVRLRDSPDSAFFADGGKHIFSLSLSRRPGAEMSITVLDRLRTELAVSLDGSACAAFSHNSKRVATVAGHEINVYDTAGFRRVQTLGEHHDAVTSLAFSPDGHWLASASNDGTVKIWNARTGKVQVTFDRHTDRITCVRFDPTGLQMLSAGVDGIINIWDPQTGQVERTWNALVPLRKVLFSHDGTQVAGISDGSPVVKIWRTKTDDDPLAFQGASGGTLGDLAFSPDGRHIAGACEDGTIRIFDVAKSRQVGSLGRSSDEVRSISFSPDGERLVSGNRDGSLTVWDFAGGESVLTLREHQGPVTEITFSPNGRWIASVGDDGKLKLWDSGRNWDR